MRRNNLTEDMKSRMLELMCSRLGVTVSDLQGGKVDWNRDKSTAVWTVAHEVVGFSETQLRNALHNYKSHTSRTYRPEFEAGLKVIAPQWFSHDSDGKKAELKAMALRGEPRPVAHGKNKHPLGQALKNYTIRSSRSYDPVFDQEIRALRPDWFVFRSDIAAQNKLELLAMALRGEPRPASDGKNRHPLGVVLRNYTNSSSNTYDPVFDQEIRALRPDWFTWTDKLKNSRAAKKKEQACLATS